MIVNPPGVVMRTEWHCCCDRDPWRVRCGWCNNEDDGPEHDKCTRKYLVHVTEKRGAPA